MTKISDCYRVLLGTLFSLVLVAAASMHAASAAPEGEPGRVGLPGHVLPALANATQLPTDSAKLLKRREELIALTVVLRRSDPYGFERYLTDVYDPQSDQYRKFLTAQELADRFGPTPQDYDAVLTYFAQQGFILVEGSANRMTLTLSGTRAQAENALHVQINNYKIAKKAFNAKDRDPSLPIEFASRIEAMAGLSGDRKFFANTTDPSLPPTVASRVEAVIGLSNLAVPARANWIDFVIHDICGQKAIKQLEGKVNFGNVVEFNNALDKKTAICFDANKGGTLAHAWNWNFSSKTDPPAPSYVGVDGTGQKIGLVEFDTFLMSDVSDFATLAVLQPATTLANISQVHVGGGATAGAQQAEVLLDIDDVITAAPGAQLVVYDAPFSGAGSFQAIFNAMINGGVTIISNSWTYCEDQTTLSDVQSIESILQTAAAAGISVLSATGDFGSSCWNGSANTAQVPTTSPHITAVGGTSPTFGPGFAYAGETWWDGSATSPPTGQGGFGTSKFFARPAYQAGVSNAAMRSVPDVTGPADPTTGVKICQASGGGCPTDFAFGGTSSSTPIWAAWVALLNQAQGANLGFLNPSLYPLAATNAFYNAVSMGTDFAHVGLGTPNVARLHQHLTNQTSAATDPDVSELHLFTPEGLTLPKALEPLLVPADGTSIAYLVVRLWDAMGNIVAGHTVTITPSPGAHVAINAVPTSEDGIAIFSVSDTTAETVAFSATDVTAGVTLLTTTQVQFTVPPAAAGSIVASPSSLPADGSSATTITITLKDALNQPTPGKTITLFQGGGHSIITGPSPAVTDASGQIKFTATDNVAETVTYTAVDVTDGHLPVPGSASVTFTGGSSSCAGTPVTAAPGFTVTPFATGFVAKNFFYSGVSFGGCAGAIPTFDAAGNMLAADFSNGNLYKLSPSGGAVSNANILASLGLTIERPVFGKDGRMYSTHVVTGGGVSTGDVIEIDPSTGAVVRTLVTGLTCAGPLAVDPLSGDLFLTDICVPGNPSLWRIQNPASASPTLTVYATLPGDPGGEHDSIVFAPNGTIYVVASGVIVQVAGTDTPSPPATSSLGIASGPYIALGEAQANGAAKSLIVQSAGILQLIDITTSPFTSTALANSTTILSPTVGPDGCLYFGAAETTFKLGPNSGGCGFTSTNPFPTLVLAPAIVSPNPAQGTAVTLTAKFMNVPVPAGTPVSFHVSGANIVFKSVTTDASGTATFTYTGLMSGQDTVLAYGSPDPGVSPALLSNTSSVTWGAGRHVSQIYLNAAPQGGNTSQQTVLVTALFDLSVDPQAPIAGATIQMSVGGSSCNATTNSSGVASCSVTLASAGNFTLTAFYAGSASYTASTAAKGFVVLPGTSTVTVPGAPTIGTAIAGNGQVTVSFTAPTSDGGSPITGYVVACTPVGGGTTVTATGTASPITVTGLTNGVAYTCTVSAINSVGTGPPSAASNVVTPIAQGLVTPVATGLNNPRGLGFGPGGVVDEILYVGEAGLGAGNGAGGVGDGIGLTGSVGAITGIATPHPTFKRIVTKLASFADPDGVVGPDGVSPLGNGDIHIIIAESTRGVLADDPSADPAIAAQFGRLLRASQSGQWQVVADVGDFDYSFTEQNKDQPWAPAGQFPDANPYAVLSVPGRQYVVDAAANTVDQVRANGAVKIIAYVPNPLFPATPGGPPVIPISDAVPTCVAQGADGFLYVGTLPFGATFARFSDPTNAQGHAFWAGLPPQAKVYRFNPNRTDIFLTEADVWASELDPITGCGFGNGAFYVTEFFTQASGFTSGAVVRIAINPDGSAGARTLLGVGVLHEPNGFAAGADGSIYVSNNSTSPGVAQTPGARVGEVVRVDH